MGILNAITKQMILSTIVIVSSQITWLIWILGQYQSIFRNKVMIALSFTSFCIDCALNCLCILLTFSFQQQYYAKLCGKCDGYLQQSCNRYMGKGTKSNERQKSGGRKRKVTLLLQN